MKRILIASLALITFTPTRASATPIKSCPEYESLFREYKLPVKQFSKIAYRESRCNPKSISAVRHTGKPDVGLLQIQGSWATVTRNICKVKYSQVIKALTKVRCNLAVASYLYQNGGIGHWKGTSGHVRNN
jgi:hypothetical protein